MNEHSHEIEKLSAPSLLAGFAKSRLTAWIVVATLIHVVVIGGLSFEYIRDTWINPEGAILRKQQAEEAARAAMKTTAGQTNTTTAADAPSTNQASAAAMAKSEKPLTEEDQIRDERKKTPVMQEINEATPTNEIPREPDDLGLSIRDVKVK